VKLYRYILTSDTGMAPCIDDGLVSLATCKPVIRRCASLGDWVIGCHAGPTPGVVAWAGRIIRALPIGSYEQEFRGRSDAIYRQRPDGTFERLRPDYHPDPRQIKRDESGFALVFDPDSTWYFGDKPKALPGTLLDLAPNGQGHRVNGVQTGDGARLLLWLESIGLPGIHGQPLHDDDDPSCSPCKPRPKNRGNC
jgi:hypothetical protein